jgi:chromosome segregation ATPase
MSELPSNEAEAIKADIEQARAELASAADALAAKLDVKAQANRKMHEVRARVGTAYSSAKHATPEPVQRAWTKAEAVTSPAVKKAAEDKKRTALIFGAVVVAAVLVRRFTR